MNRYDEFDYDVDYRELEPTSDRVLLARTLAMTGKQKFATQSRHRRGGASPKLQNGMHRRSLQPGTR
jgi:hypothetical protein